MQFIFLTEPEVESAQIRWDDNARKSPELVSAALAAGFSRREIEGSPLGVLTTDFQLDATCTCKAGSRVLIGTNGSTLIELP